MTASPRNAGVQGVADRIAHAALCSKVDCRPHHFGLSLIDRVDLTID
jgi:hypothetical protein